MTTIRVKPEELETVAKHVPDAEGACRRARTLLSWELPSLAIEIPGIGSAAIHELTDELLHWLRRYEEKLNEAEELLYRAAAAIRQADQTLADNMKEFGLELLGWYDLQRLFGEYDPITGERISGWGRLFAGGMLLLSVIPPAKGAGVAGKAGIKGAKAEGTAADVSKLVSQTKNVLHYDKIKSFFQTIYHQVIKGPITETIRSFKKQWENFLKNVGSVLQGPQPALAGIGPTRGVWISRAEREAKGMTMNMIGKTRGEVVVKSTDNIHDPYAGVKQASEYLKSQGVPRKYRKQVLESFDVRTISVEVADENTYGLRFYDDINAYAKGRYLFETFTEQINRNNLALPPEWNQMTKIQQWKVKPGSIIIKGNAASQLQMGDRYIGGAKQWYITNLDDLTKP
jgi:Pre-toxin TG